MCSTSWKVLFIIERVVSNDRPNSIHDTDENHTKRTRLSEKNTINECVDENTNSLYCSAKEETSEREMNGTGLNLQILMAIRTVILNHKENKL